MGGLPGLPMLIEDRRCNVQRVTSREFRGLVETNFCLAAEIIYKNLEIPNRPRMQKPTLGGAKSRRFVSAPNGGAIGMKEVPVSGAAAVTANEGNPVTSEVDQRRNLP